MALMFDTDVAQHIEWENLMLLCFIKCIRFSNCIKLLQKEGFFITTFTMFVGVEKIEILLEGKIETTMTTQSSLIYLRRWWYEMDDGLRFEFGIVIKQTSSV